MKKALSLTLAGVAVALLSVGVSATFALTPSSLSTVTATATPNAEPLIIKDGVSGNLAPEGDVIPSTPPTTDLPVSDELPSAPETNVPTNSDSPSTETPTYSAENPEPCVEGVINSYGECVGDAYWDALPNIVLQPCATDGDDLEHDCYWNAKVQGNGQGRNFIQLDGHIYYAE